VSAPQGLFYFAGIRSLVAASFTFTPGISPNACTLYIAPQRENVADVGPLVLQYAGGRLTFPECKADKVDFEIGGDRRIMVLTVLDRRWKWRLHGRISGYYNVRKGDGRTAEDSIVPETLRSTRQLATMCLDAMGERRYDVSLLPDDQYPVTEWDYELPAEALARLSEAAGYRVVLTLNNIVRICPVGIGAKLPSGPNVTEDSETLDPPEAPDRLVFVGGRSRFQQDFLLEPVMKETDGRIVKLNDSAFKPKSANGWSDLDFPDCGSIPDIKARRLVQAWAFKAYRIVTPLTLFGAGRGGGPEVINNLSRILPIESIQIETAEIDFKKQPKPAQVWGLFNTLNDKPGDGVRDAYGDNVSKPQPNLRAFPESEYGYNPYDTEKQFPGGFSIDQENGIVHFAEPVYRYKTTIGGAGAGGFVTIRLPIPAKLWLRTTCSVRDATTRGWLRAEVFRDLRRGKSKLGNADRYLIHDDATFEHWISHDPVANQSRSNEREIKEKAAYYLDAAQRDYQLSQPRSVSIVGWLPVSPDGAISQVTWSVGEDGFATMRASRNREEALPTPNHAERRLFERVRAALLVADKPARAMADDRHKDRG